MKFISKIKKSIILLLFCISIFLANCSKDEVNIAPTIENQEFTISEGNLTASLGTVIAKDPDDENLLFSIVSQSVSNAIVINENTGVLQISDESAFDFEVNQKLTAIVSVSDGSIDAQATITINITDEIDQSPTIQDQAFTIDENPTANQVIGQVVATDPQNAALTYVIKQQSVTGAMAISSTGELTVFNSSDFDYETNMQLTATVEIDNSAVKQTAVITISLNDLVDQAPVISDQTFSINENAAKDDVIETVAATDPQGLNLTYTINNITASNKTSVPGPSAVTINSETGEILVSDEDIFNYEENKKVVISLEVSNGTLTETATITININNISPPTNGLIAHYKMNDNSQSYAIDSSGNNNNAEFEISSTADIPLLVQGFNGKQNNAFTNPNSSKNIILKHNTSILSQANAFTIAGHFKSTETGADSFLLDDGSLFQLYYSKNATTGLVSLSVYFKEGPKETRGILSIENFNVSSNGWIHFAITQSEEEIKLYVDGIQVGMTNAIAPFHKLSSNGNQTLHIGSQNSLFLVSFDNFIIYERRLSDEEIKIISKEEN